MRILVEKRYIILQNTLGGGFDDRYCNNATLDKKTLDPKPNRLTGLFAHYGFIWVLFDRWSN